MLEYAQKLDSRILVWMRSWIDPGNGYVTGAIRYIADIEMLAMAILLAGLWSWGIYKKNNKFKKNALLLLYIIALSYVMYWCMSLFIFERTRPELVSSIVPLINHIPDNSFPSGHAIFAGASLAGLYLIGNRILLVIFFFLYAAMLLARIFAGIHYPGDILAGLIFGAVFASCLSLFRKKQWFETYAIEFPLRIAAIFKL